MPKLSLLLLPALVAACTTMSPTPEAAPPTAPAPMASMAPAFPAGATYTFTIVPGDLPANSTAEMQSGMVGAWEIAFGTNGRVTASYGGRQVVDGAYSVNGTELAFGEDTGEYACHAAARYRWHATATELHLIKVEDACDGRAVALTAHALVRK